MSLGTATAIDYIPRFGFQRNALPDNLTLALGTTQATPLQIASGYAVFANGGYRVQPYFINRIENAASEVLWRAKPKVAGPHHCSAAWRVLARAPAARPMIFGRFQRPRNR